MSQLQRRAEPVSKQATKTGMEEFNRELEQIKAQQNCPYARLAHSNSVGMFFFAIENTGVTLTPHKIVTGFVPNQDQQEVGVKAGKYGRIDFGLNGQGTIESVSPTGLTLTQPRPLIKYAKRHFGETISRYVQQTLKEEGDEAAEVLPLINFLNAPEQVTKTIPAEKLPNTK